MGEGEIQNVATISPQHRTLEAPESLKALPSWLVWRLEQTPGEKKPRKIPYWCNGAKRHGKHGSPEDRSRLVTFAAARDFAIKRGYDGVGFAPLPEWGITALDFDHCIGPDGQIPPEIIAIVGGTYTEYSPSGTGLRAFVRGDLGNHKDKAREGHFGFETFASAGFVTYTGNTLPICELAGTSEIIADANPPLLKLCEARFGSREGKKADPDDFMAGNEPRLGLTPEQIEALIAQLDPGMSRNDWIRVGMALHHECEGDDTGLELWDNWSCTADNYVSREDLETQWASFERRQGSVGPQVTMRSVLKLAKSAEASSRELAAALEEGTKLAENTPAVRTPVDYDGKFKVLTATDLSSRPPVEWLMKGIIPKTEIIALFGPSGSGKSFTLIDLLGAISRGVPWRGHRVKQGRVLIVAAEGSGSFNRRLEAYAQTQGVKLEDLNIGVITDAPNLMEKDDISEIVKAIGAAGGVDIVALDTFAQTIPGANENSGEDMGLALAHAKAIHKATGAVVVLVLHTGKDVSKGSRGWSGIKAAMDAQIEVVKNEHGSREIHLEKMRDGQDGLRFGFRLDVIDLGIDADGDAITSCVIAEDEIRSAPPSETKAVSRAIERLGPVERTILDTARVTWPDHATVRYDALLSAVIEALPPPEHEGRDTRRQRVVRALKAMSGKNGLIEIHNGSVTFFD